MNYPWDVRQHIELEKGIHLCISWLLYGSSVRLILFSSVSGFVAGGGDSYVDNVLCHFPKFSLEDIRISAPDQLYVDVRLYSMWVIHPHPVCRYIFSICIWQSELLNYSVLQM